MSEKVSEVFDTLAGMGVIELHELKTKIESEWGVSATYGVVQQQPQTETPVEEEKTSFTVTLVAAGDKRLEVIKTVRLEASVGLKEAKELVDSLPSVLAEDVTEDRADKLRAAIEEAGGAVEIT